MRNLVVPLTVSVRNEPYSQRLRTRRYWEKDWLEAFPVCPSRDLKSISAAEKACVRVEDVGRSNANREIFTGMGPRALKIFCGRRCRRRADRDFGGETMFAFLQKKRLKDGLRRYSNDERSAVTMVNPDGARFITPQPEGHRINRVLRPQNTRGQLSQTSRRWTPRSVLSCTPGGLTTVGRTHNKADLPRVYGDAAKTQLRANVISD